MVREGTGEGTLGLAVGHIPNTALPGEKGNVGLAAHRDTLFRGLKDIRQNDLIQFETLSGNHSYRVETTRIVKPEDVSVLKPGPAPELTLVTCYPFHYIGNAPERFIVKAREVKARETVQESAARPQPNAKPPQPRAKLPQPNAKKRPAHVQRRKSRRVELAAIARPDWR